MDHHHHRHNPSSSSQHITSTGSSTFLSHDDLPFSPQHLHQPPTVSAPTSQHPTATTNPLSSFQQSSSIIAQQQQFQPLEGRNSDGSGRGGGGATPPFSHQQLQLHRSTPQPLTSAWMTTMTANGATIDQQGGGNNNNTMFIPNSTSSSSSPFINYSSVGTGLLSYPSQSTNDFNNYRSLNPSTQHHQQQQTLSSSIQERGGGQPHLQQYFLPTTTNVSNPPPPSTIIITPSSSSAPPISNNNNSNSGLYFETNPISAGSAFNTTSTGGPLVSTTSSPSYFGNPSSTPFSGYAPLPINTTSSVYSGAGQAMNNGLSSSAFYPSYPSQHHHQTMRNFNMDLGGGGGGTFFYNNNMPSCHLPSTVSHHQPYHQQHHYNRHHLPHYSQAPARPPSKQMPKAEKKKVQPPPPPPPPVISTDDHVKSQLHRQCSAIVAHDLAHEVEDCEWFINRASWEPAHPTDAVSTTSATTPAAKDDNTNYPSSTLPDEASTSTTTTSQFPSSVVGSPVDILNDAEISTNSNLVVDDSDSKNHVETHNTVDPITQTTNTLQQPNPSATTVPATTSTSGEQAPQAKAPIAIEGPFAKLIVNAVASSVTNSDLYDIFSAFGKIEGCRIAQDRARNRSKGYAFVYFENYKDATHALLHCNYIEVKGRQLRVTFSVNPLNKMLFTSSSEEDEAAEKEEEEEEATAAAVVDNTTTTFISSSTTGSMIQQRQEEGQVQNQQHPTTTTATAADVLYNNDEGTPTSKLQTRVTGADHMTVPPSTTPPPHTEGDQQTTTTTTDKGYGSVPPQQQQL